MQPIRYDEVNNAEVMTFLSVARTLSMTASAKELCISQPAVSQRINRLEKTYGLILFIRNKNGTLRLTPAGKVFYEEMSDSFRHMESAFSKAFTMQTGLSDELRIGHDGTFDLTVLYEICQRFKEGNPGIGINVYSSPHETLNDLLDGRADLVIRPEASVAQMRDFFNFEVVGAYTFHIIASKKHPLAAREHLSVADLAGVPLTVAHMDATSPYVTTLNNMFLRHGITPQFDKVTSTETLCFNVMLSEGISIASPSFWTRLNAETEKLFWENMRVFPLDEDYPMAFIWKRGNEPVHVKRFMQTYGEVIEEEYYSELLRYSYSGS